MRLNLQFLIVLTTFNALTGMNQHTGNWPGKTVANAQGTHRFNGNDYILVDLPGTYSIMAHSAEEEVARDFILFGGADAAVVVCDATCMERNLNLVLQVMEITPNVVVCVNLMDEAKKRGIHVDLEALERELGVPVAGTSARSGKGLAGLMEKVEALCAGTVSATHRTVRYNPIIKEAVSPLAEALSKKSCGGINREWLSLRILERDAVLSEGIRRHLGEDLYDAPAVRDSLEKSLIILENRQISVEKLKDMIVSCIVFSAEEVMAAIRSQDCRSGNCAGCGGCDACGNGAECSGAVMRERDRKLDKILTSKHMGIPIMLALLCGVFWLTISGANIPSSILADGLFWLQDRLTEFFLWLKTPEWVNGILILGVYRVLAWVVSVMLPPMAIFFPLFTLLEDFGYLPRIAFNLDHQFKKAKACGKQALTMCIAQSMAASCRTRLTRRKDRMCFALNAPCQSLH